VHYLCGTYGAATFREWYCSIVEDVPRHGGDKREPANTFEEIFGKTLEQVVGQFSHELGRYRPRERDG
jgi:hypothetical protein